MKKTTLCYIEYDNSYLMLLRNKKENDQSEGKWLGIGGKFEENETPAECMLREVFEESGIILKDYTYNGVVHFKSEIHEDEDMFLFTAPYPDNEKTDLPECNEGTLKWINKKDVLNLNLWEGDVIFLKKLLNNEKDIELTLFYDSNDKLIKHL